MRLYNEQLVKEIQSKEYIQSENGLDILSKPVPDDPRANIMDPRVLEICKKKKEMFSQRAADGFSLANERNRPDKVSYDLSGREILRRETLIPVYDSDYELDHFVDAFIYRPAESNGEILPVVVFFHGGGWTAGSIQLYEKQMKLISDLGNCVVVFPEYRLAPETPCPGAIEDCMETINWVVDQKDELHINPQWLMVAGDSAGGGLANSCLVLDHKQNIKKVFEIYPACDVTPTPEQDLYDWHYDQYPVIEDHREYALSRIDRIKVSMDSPAKDNLYLQGKTDPRDPLVSIIYASDEVIDRLPPIVIAECEYDFLRIQDEYFARLLKEHNKDVKVIRYMGCDHGFLDFLGTIPQAEEVCITIAKELKELMKKNCTTECV